MLSFMNKSSVAFFMLMGCALPLATAEAAGLMTPKGGDQPPLEMKEHHVSVVVESGFALTTVEQTFYNPHPQDLEALYSFPVPDRGAFSSFTYWIDGQPVHGEVLPKKRAKEHYQQEKKTGARTALAEQEQHHRFKLHVWPVKAQDQVRIQFSYMQPLSVDGGIGRYVYPLEEGGVDQAAQSFWHMDDHIAGQFSFNMQLRDGYPITAVRTPAHPNAKVTQHDPKQWQVQLGSVPPAVEQQAKPQTNHTTTPTQPLDKEQPTAPHPASSMHHQPRLDKDIVVYWRHQKNLPGRVDMVTYKPSPQARGTFLMTLTPGSDLAPLPQGRDWILVLDKSGSMGGKIATLAQSVAAGLKKLPKGDRFQIIMFDQHASKLNAQFQPVNHTTVQKSIEALTKVRASGGTNLYAGLSFAMRHLERDRPTGVILISDGEANIDRTHKRDFLALLKHRDVRLFTAIMGNSANRPLLKELSRLTQGTAINISNSDDILGMVMQAASKLSHEALHGTTLKIDGIKTADLTLNQLASLYRGEQLIMMGHYWGDGLAEVTLKGKHSGKPIQYKTQFHFPKQSTLHPELDRLWAFATIDAMEQRMELLGENRDQVQASTDLAVEYGLVTPRTSMLVVEEARFQQLGIKQHNAQRLQREHKAQQARLAQTPLSHRVDQAQPMFNTPQSTHISAGAVDPVTLLALLLGIAGPAIRRMKS
ncbi:VIT and vWA domain-containing protein [Magnetococcus sp. PR-3]|uniref:VIT and vWA domain-containing protein n=1 Tax=Magnetococcus sp. PR-3 TaxID=3120355 RepID=UPI002FCE3161